MRQYFQVISEKIKSIDLRNLNIRKHRKYIPLTVFIAFAVIALAGTVMVLANKDNQDTRVEVQGARANQDINQEFPIVINDENGDEVTQVKMVLESVELRDEIIVQGKRATSVKGRTFLIVNAKLTNTYSKGVNVNVKDYFRLTVNGNESELLAADIHNDPILVQPSSTKYTRIGFPINDTDTGLALWVGEIGKDKQKVELNLK